MRRQWQCLVNGSLIKHMYVYNSNVISQTETFNVQSDNLRQEVQALCKYEL